LPGSGRTFIPYLKNDYLTLVRKLVLIILASQLLTSGQVLGELMKVVNLIDHYTMHMKSGEVHGLSEFIQLHYFNPEHEQSDPVRHRHLPLQQLTAHAVVVLAVSADPVSIPSVESHLQDTPSVRSSDFFPQQVPLSVFQPPRA
jgi:hypothetical protein